MYSWVDPRAESKSHYLSNQSLECLRQYIASDSFLTILPPERESYSHKMDSFLLIIDMQHSQSFHECPVIAHGMGLKELHILYNSVQYWYMSLAILVFLGNALLNYNKSNLKRFTTQAARTEDISIIDKSIIKSQVCL